MILLPRAVRVYFATQPVSLRRSFDGLSNEVRAVLGHSRRAFSSRSPRCPGIGETVRLVGMASTR